MVKKPIVLILGAGASVPFGFPSGTDLVLDILETVDIPDDDKERSDAQRALYAAFAASCDRPGDNVYVSNTISEFYRTLNMSNLESIDNFLMRYPGNDLIGRLAIATVLLDAEDVTPLTQNVEARRQQMENGNWYRKLGRMLSAPYEDFHKNRLSVITYNYDRSLEQFLVNSFHAQGGKTSAEWAAKLSSTIPIVHLHGVLGVHPAFDCGEKESVEFGKPVTAERVISASKCIRVVHDDIKLDEDAAFRMAYGLMAGAEAVFFLGFGYDTTNLQRLQLRRIAGKNIYGTGKVVTQARRKAIVETVGIAGLAVDNIGDYDADCLEFIENDEFLQACFS